MKPTNLSRKREIVEVYDRLIQKRVKNSRLTEWADEVEMVFRQAEAFDLGLLKDMKPFQDIIKCFSHLDIGWAGFWEVQLAMIQKGKASTANHMVLLSAIELLRQFRSIYSQEKPYTKGSFPML